MGFFFQSKSQKKANKLQKEANRIAQQEYELEKATSEWNQDYTMNQYLYTSQDMANAGLNPLMAVSNGASSSQASTTSGGSGGSTAGSPSTLSDLTALLSPVLGFVSQAKNRSNSVSMNNARIDAQKDISDASLVNQSLIALLDRQSREKIADDSQPIKIGPVSTTKGVLRDSKDLVSEYLPKSGSSKERSTPQTIDDLSEFEHSQYNKYVEQTKDYNSSHPDSKKEILSVSDWFEWYQKNKGKL